MEGDCVLTTPLYRHRHTILCKYIQYSFLMISHYEIIYCYKQGARWQPLYVLPGVVAGRALFLGEIHTQNIKHHKPSRHKIY